VPVGLPTPLDPYEAQRLLFTLLLLSSMCASHERVPVEARSGSQVRDRTVSNGRRAAGGRHVRPPRSC
jgi:hypothetical protein